MENNLFETDFKKKKRLREESVYREYKNLMSVQGQSKMKVMEFLSMKYEYASVSSIYSIIKKFKI